MCPGLLDFDQGLVGAQLPNLLFQLLNLGRLRSNHPRRVTVIDVSLRNLRPHRLHAAPELLGHRGEKMFSGNDKEVSAGIAPAGGAAVSGV